MSLGRYRWRTHLLIGKRMRALECAAGETASRDIERAYYRRRGDVHDVVGSGARLKILVAEIVQVRQM